MRIISEPLVASQVANVLAGFNATLTRSNGVYERDLGIHLNLIPQTTDVIYYDPVSDPYSDDLGNWNNELAGRDHCSRDHPAMYDIGHMFGASGGGGNAGCIGCVCRTHIPPLRTQEWGHHLAGR